MAHPTRAPLRSLLLHMVLLALLGAAIGSCSRSPSHGTTGPGASCPQGCLHCGDGVCLDCPPGGRACAGADVALCNPDGTFGTIEKTCDVASNEACMGGKCMTACEVAAASHSYIGCDYWPVTLLNSLLNPYFDFAVAVANPAVVGDVVQGQSAHVIISRGSKVLAQKDIAPGAVETITLPWVNALSQPPTCNGGLIGCIPGAEVSASVVDGAYHLVSSLPVTVYQFNPLQFEKPSTATCTDSQIGANNKLCHSFSNDASILLPSTALRGEYVVVARQSFGIASQGGPPTPALPGFLAIVATDGNTTVHVTSSAFTEAGSGVKALSPGESATFQLAQGQVLELVSKRATGPCVHSSMDATGSYCDLGDKYDLTGTHITADLPIAVFGGHTCTFVPFDRYACDHLEEQITPLETWGRKVIAVQTRPQTAGEPNYFRVVSGTDGNMITFDPPVHAPVTLDAGRYLEFSAQGGFQASGTGRVAIGQFMVGENATDGNPMVGDPAMGLGVPVEQYRTSYDFLTPSTYTKSHVTVINSPGGSLVLDGKPAIGSDSPIGGTSYSYRYIELTPGAHHLTGDAPFGITVSGIASYTSYLYVGGQNLNEVSLQ